MMRILFPFPDKTLNNYIPALRAALLQVGVESEVDYDLLFSDEVFRFDQIHFQWVASRPCDEAGAQAFEKRIALLKGRIPLMMTRHDSVPHGERNRQYEISRRWLDTIENACDGMIHHGTFSEAEFRAKGINPGCRHFCIPHHIYDGCFDPECYGKAEARALLGIPPDACVILAFGAFRFPEEWEMVYRAFRRARIPGKFLLAPGYGYKTEEAHTLLFRLKHPRYLWRTLHNRLTGVRTDRPVVSNELLPYYFAAADITFIQRRTILNSGNLPLGFHFGTVVAGCRSGNVGEILEETCNFSFDPLDPDSVTKALEAAYDASLRQKGSENSRYARENWSDHAVALQTCKAYRQNQHL